MSLRTERKRNMIDKEGLPAWLWQLANKTLSETGGNMFAPKRLREETTPRGNIPFDKRGGLKELVFRAGKLIRP